MELVGKGGSTRFLDPAVHPPSRYKLMSHGLLSMGGIVSLVLEDQCYFLSVFELMVRAQLPAGRIGLFSLPSKSSLNLKVGRVFSNFSTWIHRKLPLKKRHVCVHLTDILLGAS